MLASRSAAQMVHLYFDIRENDNLSSDSDGLEFHSIERARDEALKVIFDLAKDAIPNTSSQNLSIEVRTANGDILLKAILTLHVEQFD
jgi:hypothetical protein